MPPTQFHDCVGFFFSRNHETTRNHEDTGTKPRSDTKTTKHDAIEEGIMATIEVGILGATGAVGQQFIALLANHPWFKVTWLGASQRSEGKPYRDATAWRLPTALPSD